MTARGRLILTNALLVDGEHPAQPGQTVVVEGDRIAAVQPVPVGETGERDRTVDPLSDIGVLADPGRITVIKGGEVVSGQGWDGLGPSPASSNATSSS